MVGITASVRYARFPDNWGNGPRILANGIGVATSICNILPGSSGQRLLGHRRGFGGGFPRRFDQRIEFGLAMEAEAGAGRDDVPHNDVFLEAAQVINPGHGRGFGQDARGVLEGGGAEEALGFERGFGDAQQHRLGLRRLAAHFVHALVFVVEFDFVDLLASEEGGGPRLGNAHLAQHLAHDDLDVLVVDRYPLQTVNLLDFVDEMFLQFLRAADVQDFVRVDRPFGQLLALFDIVALEDNHMLADGNEVFFLQSGLLVLDNNAAFAAHARSEIDDAVDLGNFRGVFGPARFEKFGHAREAAGDVFGLGGLARSFGHQRSGDDLVAFGDHDVGAGGDGIIGGRLALVGGDDDLGVQILLVLDDDHGFLGGGFIDFLLHGHAFNDVVEPDLAGFLGEDWHVVGVPLDEGFGLLDVAAVGHLDDRADDEVVQFEFAAVLAENGDGTVFVQDDGIAVFQLDQAQIVVANGALVFGFDLRLLEHGGGGAPDVEGAHGELGARLADGLGRDDADGFAQFHQAAGGQIAAIASDADAFFALAGEDRTEFNFLHAGGFDGLGAHLINFLVGLGNHGLGVARVMNVVTGKTADEPLAQLDHFVLAFVNRLHPDAVASAAILLPDDDVLRHVHQLAGHVTGVGGLEGGVGQALAGAVGRNEVFEDGEAFAKVGQDRFFDDVAGGLGHEAAQTGQLADLLLVAAGAGVD